jgi:hypothetical protein
LGALAWAAYQYFTPAVPPSGGASVVESVTPSPTPASAETPSPGVSPNASVSPSPSPTVSPTPEVAPAGPMRVQLTAPIEDVWISVKQDGEKAQQMILKPGETREFNVNEKLVLGIGRVPSLRMTINGRNVNFNKLLPNLKGIIATNVVITKDNYQEFLD